MERAPLSYWFPKSVSMQCWTNDSTKYGHFRGERASVEPTRKKRGFPYKQNILLKISFVFSRKNPSDFLEFAGSCGPHQTSKPQKWSLKLIVQILQLLTSRSCRMQTSRHQQNCNKPHMHLPFISTHITILTSLAARRGGARCGSRAARTRSPRAWRSSAAAPGRGGECTS